MLRFDKATYLLLILKFILSERLSNSLCMLKVLLFSENINRVSFLYYDRIKFVVFLNTFLVLLFARYEKYMI